jgi:hypothetical protein
VVTDGGVKKRAALVTLVATVAVAICTGTVGAERYPSAQTTPWHVVTSTETWGMTVSAWSCNVQLACAAIATHAGREYAVRFDSAGIQTVSRVLSKLAPNSVVNCANSEDCQGLHNSGAPLSGHWSTSLYRTTDGGVRWSTDPLPPSLLIANVSCATTERCLVIGRKGPYSSTKTLPIEVYVTNDGGVNWTSGVAPSLQTSTIPSGLPLSCAANGACVATSWVFPPANISITSNFGKAWSSVAVPSNQTVIAASCSGTTDCHVLTSQHSKAMLWTIPQKGGAASSHPLTGSANGMSTLLSCPTTLACYIGAERQTSDAGFVHLTSNSGTAWSIESLPGKLTGVPLVSCGLMGRCIAVASGSNVIAVRR